MSNLLLAEDKTKALELVQDLKNKVTEVISHVQNQVSKVEQGECNTSKGVSFLEVKYQMLLSYLINLTQLLCVRVHGQSIKGNPVIERLAEIRTVLEKMRPIDRKLKYQVDKLLKTATTGTIGQNDPLRLKPNPDNLQSKFEEESSDDSEDEDQPTSSNVYKPPKLAAVYYDGDETEKQKHEKVMQRAKKRALSSSVMQDLRAEYFDGPVEIKEVPDLHRTREHSAAKERTEYEEKYFLRMALTKKQKNESKKIRTGLDDLTKFGDFSSLIEEGQLQTDGPRGMKRKKRATRGKKGKGSKKSKRRK